MSKALLFGTLLSASVLLTNCSGNQNNNGNSSNNNSESNAATIENVWISYLNSSYIDCPKVADASKAITHLYAKTATSAKLVINDYNGDAYTEDEAYHVNDDEEEAGDAASGYFFEYLAMYKNKAGGHTVVLLSQRHGFGYKMMSIFSYNNGELKRLANQFPQFEESMLWQESRPEAKMWDLQGKEVVYFDFSCAFDENALTKDGFTFSFDDIDRQYKWNGEKFE